MQALFFFRNLYFRGNKNEVKFRGRKMYTDYDFPHDLEVDPTKNAGNTIRDSFFEESSTMEPVTVDLLEVVASDLVRNLRLAARYGQKPVADPPFLQPLQIAALNKNGGSALVGISDVRVTRINPPPPEEKRGYGKSGFGSIEISFMSAGILRELHFIASPVEFVDLSKVIGSEPMVRAPCI
jgi:hypothetical protein